MTFDWDTISYDTEGKIKLLYRHQRILDEKVVSPGMQVLDIGGWGILAARLKQENIKCTILDNFTEDQYYPERVKSLCHIKGDILEEAALSKCTLGSYDVVTCFEMLEHCANQKLAIFNIFRLLKDKGALVGTFPIPGIVHAVDDPSVSFLTAEQLTSLLEEAGFNNIMIELTGSIVKDETPCSLYFKAQKGK